MAGVVISKNAETEMIPHHVIEEILTRLRVKSLLRFRCVCKTWCSFISDPQFCTNLHRRRRVILVCENRNKISTISMESLLTRKYRTPTPLALPWETEAGDQNQVIGSCNGLVCIDLKNGSSPRKSGLILWNPSTRKFRRLPRPGGYQVLDKLFTYVWFGYDGSIDDYKLVWLMGSPSHRNCSRERRLDVFTMKSNTWRRIPIDHIELLDMHFENADNGYDPKSIGFFYHRAIHWGIRYCPLRGGLVGWSLDFLTFDLATEKFQVLKFPRTLYHTWVRSIGGCLCLSTQLDKEGWAMEEDGVTLWIMKEYGVESSWTKLISVPYNKSQSYDLPLFRFYRNLLTQDPNLFSQEEVKEIPALFDYVYSEYGDGIWRLIIEGGGENVRFEESVSVANVCQAKEVHLLHMEES